MEAVSLSNGFSLLGTCPYPDCRRPSVFIQQCTAGIGATAGGHIGLVGIMQCQGCRRYILAIVDLPQKSSTGHIYREHYPIGAPDQAVATEIPEHIAEDFKEALRCQFVNAYNATAEMCRRALEASCLDLGAHKKKVLQKMIDELEEKRIITPALKNAAHKVRLGGDRGAHPPVDGPALQLAAAATEVEEALEEGPIEKIEEDHAEAIVNFTRHFFQHVYVIPKQLEKYDFSKPKAIQPHE